jgi:hypothetical protein
MDRLTLSALLLMGSLLVYGCGSGDSPASATPAHSGGSSATSSGDSDEELRGRMDLNALREKAREKRRAERAAKQPDGEPTPEPVEGADS